MIGTSVMEELNSCKSSFLKFILMLAGDTPVLRVITQMVPNKLVCLKIGERFFFLLYKFLFLFLSKNYNTNDKIKNIQKFFKQQIQNEIFKSKI